MNDYSATIFSLVDYEIWCNLQAIDFLVDRSEEERRRDFGFGLKTPHQTMFHIANVIRGWSRCIGPEIEEPTWLDYDETVSLQDMRAMFVDLSKFWQDAARRSHEKGLLDEKRRLHQLLHLVTHGTHHRGQLLSMITLMGYEQPFEGGDFGGWSNTGATTMPENVEGASS